MDLNKAFFRIGNALVNELVMQLNRNDSVDTGLLKNSIRFEVSDGKITIIMNGYAKNVEFGCFFDKNTKIRTAKGIKKLSEITSKDKILTPEGYFRVLQKEEYNLFYPVKKVVLKTRKGNRLIVTEDHPIWTSKGWKRAIEVKKGDIIING